MSKVAVITRTKDRPLLLNRAVQSVINQTFADWHLVIVNDGGNPKTVEKVLEKYWDRLQGKITTVHHDTSLGMEAASNAGISSSASEYLVIHDDDDSWQPDYLESCVNYMHKNKNLSELGGVVTHWNIVIEKIKDDRVIEVSRKIEKDVLHLSLYRMLHECYIVPICFFYKRSALQDVGLYDSSLKLAGDWEFNIRFLSKYEIGLIPRPLANYHKRLPVSKNACTNAVLEAPNLLEHYATLVRNRYLRKDLVEGKVRMGTLMNLSHHLSQLRLWHLIKNDLKRIKKLFA
jgi:glycosyltransferase involved in cell wall biosynthesis